MLFLRSGDSSAPKIVPKHKKIFRISFFLNATLRRPTCRDTSDWATHVPQRRNAAQFHAGAFHCPASSSRAIWSEQFEATAISRTTMNLDSPAGLLAALQRLKSSAISRRAIRQHTFTANHSPAGFLARVLQFKAAATSGLR